VLADNGQKAVDLFPSDRWDLVLMDMQMPVMDGISATRTLRQDARNAQLPIVAMTANSLQSDREACAAAGMNGFVVKPIEPEILWRTLKELLPKPHTKPIPKPISIPVAASSPSMDEPVEEQPLRLNQVSGLDVELGLRRVMGKVDLYRSLLRKFVDSHGGFADDMAQAMARDDWATAERLAHTLKGVAGTVGATALQEQAQSLEAVIKAVASTDIIEEALAQVVSHLRLLIEGIQASLDEAPRAAPFDIVSQVSIDSVKLRRVCQDLARLLREQDASASAMLHTHAAMLRAAFQTDYTNLETGVRNFDFEAALQALGAAAKRHAIALD
jgi:two-component system, sensor histidine kinase and response regulator